jgi:hypothetical protein
MEKIHTWLPLFSLPVVYTYPDSIYCTYASKQDVLVHHAHAYWSETSYSTVNLPQRRWNSHYLDVTVNLVCVRVVRF